MLISGFEIGNYKGWKDYKVEGYPLVSVYGSLWLKIKMVCFTCN